MYTVRKGFTLVEILIVVVILGILAAIIIPQFTNASESARAGNLATQLQTIRSQLELYQVQHAANYPAFTAGATQWDQMTLYSDAGGVTAAAGSSTYKFGPYLQQAPANPLAPGGASTVVAVDATDAGGWTFSTTSHQFRALVDSAREQAAIDAGLHLNTDYVVITAAP